MTNKLNKRFEDFGSIPNPEVWEGIEANLNGRRRKKRLLWIFLPGTVAGIIVALLLAVKPSGTDISDKENGKGVGSYASRGVSIKGSKGMSIISSTESPISEGRDKIQDRESSKGIRSYALALNDPKDENSEAGIYSGSTLISLEEENKNDPLPADSLENQQAAAALDTTSDSSFSEITHIKSPAIKNPEPARSAWSFSLQAGAWDATHNRDQLISSTPAPTTEALTDIGTSSFVPPLIGNNSVPPNPDTISVSKPLSLRANVAFTGKKGFVYTAGLNFDRMDAFYNEKETRFMSTGINLGFGRNFALSPRFSLTPLLLMNYDRFVLERGEAPSETPAAYQATTFKGKQFSLQLDLQAAFHLTEKHSFYLSPAVKAYAYQSLTTVNGPILKRDWWTGLHLGWKYNF